MFNKYVMGVLSLLLTLSMIAAPAKVEQTPLSCAGTGSHPKITAHVAGNPASVRVYFHIAGSTCGDYYVDMRRSANDPTLYTAFLPIPGAGAQVLTYEIRTTDGLGKETAGVPISVAVKTDCAAAPLTADEQRAADNITLGLTNNAQNQAPCKFLCQGVKNVMTAAHELKPNDACRLILAGLQQPWYLTPEGRAVIAGSAVVTGFGVNAAIQHNRNNRPPSPARP